VFCDFGEAFAVTDTNGEAPISVMVSSVTSEEKGVVMCLDENRHGFESGDTVTFHEVVGMPALNGAEFQIEVMGPYSFSIGDTRGMGNYVRGGIATQIKKPKITKFRSLRQSLVEPECLISDFAKMERPQQLHIGFQAVDAFRAEQQRLPQPGNAADAASIVALAQKIAAATLKIDIDAKLIATLASQATGCLVPMCGVIGGIAAQEVMKACSGKFNPIQQYLYVGHRNSDEEEEEEEKQK
jgi:ubiquitin-activating enzyme E1